MKPGGISCQEVVEIITEYLEGTLAPELVQRLHVHLELCAPCVEYIEQIRATSRAAQAAELEVHPDRDALLAVFRDFQRERAG